MTEYVNDAADLLRQYGYEICLAWTAALLLVFGNNINKIVKNVAKSWHFLLRVLWFTLVCGFCYGLVPLFLAKFLHEQWITLENLHLLVSTAVAFIVLGIFAEKKNYI